MLLWYNNRNENQKGEINMKEFMEFMKLTLSDKSVHTARSYRKHLESFFSAFGVDTLDDIANIKVSDVRSYLEERKEEGLKDSSINAEIRVLKVFINWLVQNNYIENNIIEGLKFRKEPKNLATIVTKEERNSMITSCKSIKMKLMIALMFYAGLRREEIVNVKLEDFKDGRLTIHGKGRKERILAIHPYVLGLKDKYLKHRGNSYEYLFGTQQGFGGVGAGSWHKLSVGAVRNAVKRSAELAGIEPERVDKISPHTLRRTFACDLARGGIGAFQIQKALGHHDITTTQRYIAPAGADIADEALMSQEPPE